MPATLTAYIATIIVFLGIDFVWLKYMANSFYREQLGELMLESPKLGIAGAFYLVFALAVVVLAVLPALRANDWTIALLYGALLGFAAYGTYDITNMATLKNWPVLMSLVDMAWGTVLTATTATAAFFITRAVSGN